MTSSSGTTLRPLGKPQAGQSAAVRDGSGSHTSSDSWNFSAEVQDAVVTRMPLVTATNSWHAAATITTTIIVLVVRAGKTAADTAWYLLGARNESHTVTHFILSRLRSEALLFFPFSSRSHQSTEGHRSCSRSPKWKRWVRTGSWALRPPGHTASFNQAHGLLVTRFGWVLFFFLLLLLMFLLR